jgi:hypothetical protein
MIILLEAVHEIKWLCDFSFKCQDGTFEEDGIFELDSGEVKKRLLFFRFVLFCWVMYYD